MGTIKDINGRDLVELKRSGRDGKNTQKNCIKRSKCTQNDDDGVVSHSEPDIL